MVKYKRFPSLVGIFDSVLNFENVLGSWATDNVYIFNRTMKPRL